MMTKEQIDTELRRIQQSVPKALRDTVLVRTAITPTMSMIAQKAIEDPDFPPEKKEQLQLLIDRGYFTKEKYTQNDKVAKQIDNYVNREIKKSIKEGRLPNKKQLKQLEEQWKEQKDNS